jgi:uncharacterized protein (DUF4213/DUF364 family)
MLMGEICDLLLPAAAIRTVADVRVGLGYTAVQLDDGRCGLAYTFRDEAHEGCCVNREAGTLVDRRASDLAEWAKLSDRVVAAVGLATLNALTDAPPSATEADLLTELQVTSADVIGMVGYFGPFVGPLRSRGKALHIFERRPTAQTNVLPETAAAEVLPKCDVVILSGTTLINRTLDDVLSLCRNAHEVAILGPSTPLLPAVFVNRGVTILSGVQVVEPARVLRVGGRNPPVRQSSEESNPSPLRRQTRLRANRLPNGRAPLSSLLRRCIPARGLHLLAAADLRVRMSGTFGTGTSLLIDEHGPALLAEITISHISSHVEPP